MKVFAGEVCDVLFWADYVLRSDAYVRLAVKAQLVPSLLTHPFFPSRKCVFERKKLKTQGRTLQLQFADG